MNRSAACSFVAIALSLAYGGARPWVAPVLAQSKAKAENVPEIPYESVPNFLKLPPTLHLGEGIGVATNSKGHVFVYTRSGDTRLFEFDRTGAFVRELGQGLYGFEFAHAVRVDRDDNIWAVDEGTNMVIKFNPEGRVVMVIGRRPEAVEGIAASAPAASAPRRRRNAAASAGAVRVQPPHRRRVRRRREHLRHRWVRQLPRREIRQERTVPEAGGHARQCAGAAEPPSHDGDRRAGERVRRRPQQRARAGVRQRAQRQGDLRHRREPVGRLHLARPAPVPVRLELDSGQRPLAVQGHHGRDLQDGARRHHRRKVRQGREATGRVQHGARDRLPQSERAVGSGDHRVARPEDHPGPTASATVEIGGVPGKTNDPTDDALFHPRVWPGPSPRDPVRLRPESAQDAGRHPPRRGGRRGHQFEGASVRLHAHRQSDRGAGELAVVHARRVAALRVRSERQLRPRDRPGRVRVRLRARRARRCTGQHLDRGRGGEPGRQVQPRRARVDDHGAQA